MTNDRAMGLAVMMIVMEQQKLHLNTVILAQARIYDGMTNACVEWRMSRYDRLDSGLYRFEVGVC